MRVSRNSGNSLTGHGFWRALPNLDYFRNFLDMLLSCQPLASVAHAKKDVKALYSTRSTFK